MASAIPTILKGDDSGAINITLASGRSYLGATLVVAYQGVTRSFTNLNPGQTVALTFTHNETATFALKTAPLLMRLIGAAGAEETVGNADARIKVTDCLADVNAGGSFIVTPGQAGSDPTKVPITDVGDMSSRYSLADLQAKVNQIVRVLAQRSLLALGGVALLTGAAFGGVQTARLDSLYNDSLVVTNVTDVSGEDTNAVHKTDVAWTNRVKSVNGKTGDVIVSGGADTNAVNDLIHEYVTTNSATTNLTARIDAKQDALPYETNDIPFSVINTDSSMSFGGAATFNTGISVYGGSVTVGGDGVISQGDLKSDADVKIMDGETVTHQLSLKANASALALKQDALSPEGTNAVNSGITSAKVTTYDGYAATIAGKQDALYSVGVSYVFSEWSIPEDIEVEAKPMGGGGSKIFYASLASQPSYYDGFWEVNIRFSRDGDSATGLGYADGEADDLIIKFSRISEIVFQFQEEDYSVEDWYAEGVTRTRSAVETHFPIALKVDDELSYSKTNLVSSFCVSNVVTNILSIARADSESIVTREIAKVKTTYTPTNILVSLNQSVQYVEANGSALTILAPTTAADAVRDWLVYVNATADSPLNLDALGGILVADAAYTNAVKQNKVTALYITEMTNNVYVIGRQELTPVK